MHTTTVPVQHDSFICDVTHSRVIRLICVCDMTRLRAHICSACATWRIYMYHGAPIYVTWLIRAHTLDSPGPVTYVNMRMPFVWQWRTYVRDKTHSCAYLDSPGPVMSHGPWVMSHESWVMSHESWVMSHVTYICQRALYFRHFVDISWICVWGALWRIYTALSRAYRALLEYFALVVALWDGQTHFVEISWKYVGPFGGHIGLFGGYIGLFGGYIGLFMSTFCVGSPTLRRPHTFCGHIVHTCRAL